MDDKPLLSVCLITYNHANYIEQAIESVLQQKVDFPWEVIISDDSSTDGNQEIISGYYHRNKCLIRPILHQENVGPFPNWQQMLGAARGKYIAYLEGDDYWTDIYKLKKQVAFLETHPGFAGCFHNAEERYEEETASSFLYCNFQGARSISFRDLTIGNLIPSCSMVYRNGLFREFPVWLRQLKMGDWPLHLLNAQFGDYWYIPKVMGVHRLHKMSTWMLQDAERNTKYIEEAYNTMIEGFAGNPEHVTYLLAGKKGFLEEIRLAKKAPGMKAKVKDLVIRQIRKL